LTLARRKILPGTAVWILCRRRRQVILDLISLYVIRAIISESEWAGRVARVGYRRDAYRVLVVRLAGKRHRRRWEHNIKMDIKEVKWGGTDWIAVSQDRDGWWALVSEVMNLRVPYIAGNFWTSCGSVSFSGRTVLHGGR
jgi:hypothetical protein